MIYILLLLFSLVQSTISVEAIFDLAPPDSSNRNRCTFEKDGLSFDLCPILRQNRTSWWTPTIEMSTPPTITKKTYMISLKGPLQKKEGIPDEYQCPTGTWICMIMTNIRPNESSEKPRVLQVVPIAGTLELTGNHTREHHPGLNATFSVTKRNNSDPYLDVGLSGGRYIGKEQKAHIHFICDRDVEEPTRPTFWGTLGKNQVYHFFRWNTPHACAKSVDGEGRRPTHTHTGRPIKATTTQEPSEEDLPKEDGSEEQDDFVLPESPFTPRRMTITGIIIILIAASTLGPLFYFGIHRIRRSIYLNSKGYRFRITDRKLHTWAQEEINLGGDEDTMVNANEVIFDESMPLTPSPRKSNFNQGYGSAA